MKMRFVFFAFLFSSLTLFGQSKSVEEEFEECYFNSFPDKGVQVRKLFSDFEQKLLENRVLKDKSAKSYFSVFKKIFNNEDVKSVNNYSFIDSINSLDYSNKLIHFNYKCSEKVRKRADFNQSKTYKHQVEQDSISRLEIGFEEKSKLVLATFKEDDFTTEFSKLRVLLLVEFNENSELDNGDFKVSDDDLKNGIKLFLDSNSETLVENEKHQLKEVKALVKKYFYKKKQKSVILLNSSRAASYGKYIELTNLVKNVNQEVRNEYSMKVFDKKYVDLSKAKQKEINLKFPLKMINYE